MNDERLDELVDAIRTWTRRPPSRSPRTARTRVLGRIAGPRNRTAWKLAAAAALLAVAVTVGVLLDSGPPPVTSEVTTSTSPKLLVYELRSGTQLYVALESP